MVYEAKLNIPAFSFLLMIQEMFVVLPLLMTAVYCSQILTLCKTGVLLTV
jgi:hypothetical protein